MTDDARAKAAAVLDEYKVGEFLGIVRDCQVIDLMVAFAADAVAQAVKERDAQIARMEIQCFDWATKSEQQAEEIARLLAEVIQLGQAILWADGQHEDFRPRERGEGAFWWRKELMHRAGLRPYVPGQP